jgi:hypothetical protein
MFQEITDHRVYVGLTKVIPASKQRYRPRVSIRLSMGEFCDICWPVSFDTFSFIGANGLCSCSAVGPSNVRNVNGDETIACCG